MRASSCTRILSTAVFAATSAIRLTAGDPPERRGLYAIWGEVDLPYVVGGQVKVEWADLEPAEGRYDFTLIEERFRALGDRSATLQVNGGKKPAWLFDAAPRFPEKLGQAGDAPGTLMYWHPRHQQAYRDFIHAYGAFVRAAPWRDRILGIRLNFNALGTEHWRVDSAHRDPSRWITPPGVVPGEPWTLEVGNAYCAAVVQAFADAFSPDVRVFVRNNLDPKLRGPFEARFRSGELGWFHTSTEIEPRAAWGESQYQTFLDYCRSGMALGYAEQWASAWGHHGGKTDPRWCSPPQWNYWRLLADLHCGVSFIAVYASDLRVAAMGTYMGQPVPREYQGEFHLAFEFAARYAGHHASPAQSPGAWVAFREGSFLKGDYTFLMERLPDRTAERRLVGPDGQRFGTWARVLPAGESMRLRPNAEFARSLTTQAASVRIVYLDSGTASPILSVQDQSWEVPLTDTGRWREHTVPLERLPTSTADASLDVVIRSGSAETVLHMVEIIRSALP